MALDPSLVFRQIIPSAQGIQETQQETLRTRGIFQQMRQEQQEAPARQAILEAQQAQAEIQVAEAQAQQIEAIERRDITNIARNYELNKRDLNAGNYSRVADKLEADARSKFQAGQTAEELSDTIFAIQALRSNDPVAIQQVIGDSKGAADFARDQGWIGGKADGGAQARAFAPQKDPETGQFFAISYNPNTDSFTKQEIPGAKGLTKQQEIAMETKAREEVNRLDVSKTRKKELIKQRVARAGEIRSELSDRNRNAARSQTVIQEALLTVSNASEGLTANVKTALARLLPGVDVSDEGALDSVLKRLALEQLQKFKGPTTDFEFNVTQQIVGKLGDPRSANIARLKSLSRNDWFMRQEFGQYNNFVKDGGDPDQFAFNFDQKMSTNKGEVSLKNLQDAAVSNNLTIEELLDRLNK
jgi:hypothetical protein